ACQEGGSGTLHPDHQRALEANTDMLGRVEAALRHLTHALYRVAQQEQSLMADLTALTDVVAELAADDSELKTSIDAVVAALQTAQSGGFTEQDKADLAAAVAELQTVHADVQTSPAEAQAALPPPAPPAP